jgi:hypothetical protein
MDSRTSTRDAGIARLKRWSRAILFGATALAGAFAGLAAHSTGHKSAVRTTTRTVRTTTQQATTSEQPSTTIDPAPPPVVTQQPPVVASGGS